MNVFKQFLFIIGTGKTIIKLTMEALKTRLEKGKKHIYNSQ